MTAHPRRRPQWPTVAGGLALVLGASCTDLGSPLKEQEGVLDFGTVVAGRDSSQVLTVSNPTEAATAILAISVTSDVFRVMPLDFPIPLEVDQDTSILVIFAPLIPGEYTASLEVTLDQGTGAMVELRGTAQIEVFYGAQVQPVFQARCVDCHGGNGGLFLGSYDQLLVGGNSGPAVLPGDGANSLIIRKLRGQSGSRMPLDRNPLADSTIALIESWINQGAHNN